MKIARLNRYQQNPLYREGWIHYQEDCRVYLNGNESGYSYITRTKELEDRQNEFRLDWWITQKVLALWERKRNKA